MFEAKVRAKSEMMHSFTPFIHSLNQQVLDVYYTQDTVLGKQMTKPLAFLGAYYSAF